ncbi:MAG: hypothetical protein HZC14_00495 [Candidatus Niyogibacteria bacterium]|nr:hypothetical protein [Candidatus Niyogibacteria bacterium]
MIEIIPAINTESFEEIKQKIKMVEPYAKWAHLDAADGTFTKNTIWHNPADLAGLETPLLLEAHLMIDRIERQIDHWLLPNLRRIIFHIEAAADPNFVIEKCREAGKEVGIAINPETPWTQPYPYLEKINLVQILGVHPGLAGQKFDTEVLHKIKAVRKECPGCIIEADGGMNEVTARQAVTAGADIITAASAIYGKTDIGQAINDLKNALA